MRGVTVSLTTLSHLSFKFQLTRLMRGVTTLAPFKYSTDNISTHTPHARRDDINQNIILSILISTHTPHARRDSVSVLAVFPIRNFNSHASCEA